MVSLSPRCPAPEAAAFQHWASLSGVALTPPLLPTASHSAFVREHQEPAVLPNPEAGITSLLLSAEASSSLWQPSRASRLSWEAVWPGNQDSWVLGPVLGGEWGLVVRAEGLGARTGSAIARPPILSPPGHW